MNRKVLNGASLITCRADIIATRAQWKDIRGGVIC